MVSYPTPTHPKLVRRKHPFVANQICFSSPCSANTLSSCPSTLKQSALLGVAHAEMVIRVLGFFSFRCP